MKKATKGNSDWEKFIVKLAGPVFGTIDSVRLTNAHTVFNYIEELNTK